ncbi:MAG: methyltransferase domain-containing protein [Planctomycetes bacterium]|nr:methyltransferase domain-containing protein [Planctomycetota bacterium]
MTQTDDRDPEPLDVDAAVSACYSTGATTTVPELCCPVDYDPRWLLVIPDEVVQRDYGCGDPSRHLRAGETVLDLGSGTGKICFIASQVVGATGRVIGVDTNLDMLDVARRAAPVVAERIGYANVTFLRGRIEDLAFDPSVLDARLAARPVTSAAGLLELQAELDEQRARRPLVADASVDVVVSNCVLNLVHPEKKRALFDEVFRVLKKGGRAVISDIVCDEDVPEHLRRDPELWSGCISGALREDEFLRAFEEAGFHGIEILERGAEPWRTVEGIEFRSLTVQAGKGKQGACLEQNQAVIYKGPWKAVVDDDGHTLRRGERMAVCGKTYRLLTSGPYAGQVLGVEPRVAVDESLARPFACTGERLRSPRESKGEAFRLTVEAAPSSCCEPGSCC